MTMPNERFLALKLGKKFLEDLCDPGLTPRVPSVIRERARGILRHFPNDLDFARLAENCPELLDSQPFSKYHVSDKEKYDTIVK